ncbi:zinc metalloprotease [Legionella lansingensis]|uniref:Zinc metalloprotease n=2 Tax=Legionella lansingensis TaxID=45067 RepID=A0A0W0VPR8_9GAMM|nr:SprT family zinc-dependent metalloprotease [Legionella lansingensis]KTD22097.1 zinc metalloprotease [Legionella lansingensis]SNV45822.1 zinc metalloprotease [Legionella lansingensis]
MISTHSYDSDFMTKHELEIDGIFIEIQRKAIKNMHLRVYPPNGQVKVSAPFKFHLDDIRQQLEARLPWIHQQRKRLTTHQPQTFTTDETLNFMGQPLRLLVHETTKRSRILVDGEFIHLQMKTNGTIKEKQQLLQNWYRQQMKIILPDMIKKWESILNVAVNRWGIKIMKTRWGSCNIRSRRIWLNLSLITKPLSCLEYVLVHEMIHLLETNHTKRFYALMDKFLPEWRVQQSLLSMS